MLRGVWTGEAARIISVGFLGVADQNMGYADMRYAVFDFGEMTEKTHNAALSKRKVAYTLKVIRHLARQAGIFYAKQSVPQ